MSGVHHGFREQIHALQGQGKASARRSQAVEASQRLFGVRKLLLSPPTELRKMPLKSGQGRRGE
eukprot:2741696-Amphidinium_carterae.3